MAHLKSLTGTQSQIKALNKGFFDNKKNKVYSFTNDPRVTYLLELIKQKKKILVICNSKEKVEAIMSNFPSEMRCPVCVRPEWYYY